MARAPAKQLRWGRLLITLLVLAGVGVGVYFLLTRYV